KTKEREKASVSNVDETENTNVESAVSYTSETMKLVREVVHIEEGPQKNQSRGWLQDGKRALENHRMYLRQQSSTKQNSRQEHFKIGQPSTSKANFNNNNVNEETNMEIAQAEDENIIELEIVTENIPVECDVDDFLEERVNGSTIRKNVSQRRQRLVT
ncbi:hypothetical protein JTE90_024600, partial [Oedothorax gibbosus]